MQKKSTSCSAFFNSRALLVFFLCAVACSIATGTLLAFFRPDALANFERTLTFAERVAYQRAIEDVYWRHRIWPKERPDPKPSLDAVMSQAQLEKKVADYLHKSEALEDYWHRPITAEQLQAEMDRMAKNTKQPDVLRELFEALGNDGVVVAECLARPQLTERLFQFVESSGGAGEASQFIASQRMDTIPFTGYIIPIISANSEPEGACVDDSWTATTLVGAPTARIGHTAVWTGSEMIVWGGIVVVTVTNTGGTYNPSTDSWTATNTANAPTGRQLHTAVWTGSEMIVWGGYDNTNSFNTGGRYNPATNNWTTTSTTNAPAARNSHQAVWTGSEMIIWGGGSNGYFDTGGRYDPSTNSWIATSTTNAPVGRAGHTAVWTDSEMIVWGGYFFDGAFHYFNTGGRYNPNTNSWTGTTTTNAPSARNNHTAVWTSTEMIVWGGFGGAGGLRNGGRYNPAINSWTTTSTTNAPTGRESHTAVWTGDEMIVWGGFGGNYFDTGGRYNPITDSWRATSTTNAPDGRYSHTAVWTSMQMIVWGGTDDAQDFNSGGRYCAQSGPTPTATPTPTASATPSPTPTPTSTASPTPSPTPTPCTGRCSPTPRPRPTPGPRPTPPPHGTPIPPPASATPTQAPRP